jgi:hypothetical protein
MNRISAALVLAYLAASAFPAVLVPTTAASNAFGYRPAMIAGHPDLNGVWQVMNAANYDIEAHPARSAMQMRPGPIGPVPAKEVIALGAAGSVPGGLSVVEGGTIPYKPAALATKKENQEHWIERDPEIKCYLPGVPRANYMSHAFQIFQGDKQLVFAYEYAGAVRNILFKDPGPAPVTSWMGQSVGQWDGNTLVVKVTDQNESTWFDRAGNWHSSQLVVTERYTPNEPNTMRYEATIEDPAVFTRPWKMSMNLYRRVGEDAQLIQFKCVEFVEELIYGHLRKEPLK